MMDSQPVEDPLSALLDEHARFDAAFEKHQEALLVRNAPGAATHLRRFGDLLIPHLRLEEELLVPLYEERGRPIVGASAAVFRAEHRKILADLEELTRRTTELAACATGSCRATLKQFLALIDREYLFKDYLRHHDLRERNALYPELDRVTTVEERRALKAKIAR